MNHDFPLGPVRPTSSKYSVEELSKVMEDFFLGEIKKDRQGVLTGMLKEAYVAGLKRALLAIEVLAEDLPEGPRETALLDAVARLQQELELVKSH